MSGLVINEVLTNSVPPSVDAIELHNPTGAPIQLTNYFLSDSAASLETLQHFAIPTTTVLAGGYIVFDESDFNTTGGDDPRDFALSSLGDQVYLTAGDAAGPTYFVDFVDFAAAASGESFGRYPNGSGPLAPMLQTTLGGDNSGPRVGPVLISEVQYNPGDPTQADLAIYPTLDSGDLEYVEIHNTTNELVPLTDWRIRGGADLDFDPGSTLGAGETVVVISFNPENEVNVNRVAAFRNHYGIDDSVRLVGGFGGQLDDAGERLTLQRPDTPVGDPPLIPRLLEDEVRYDDMAPWPVSADGSGDSLHRAAPTAFGNDSTSWLAGSPSPGTVDFTGGIPGDFNDDLVVDDADIDLLYAAINAGNPPARVDWDGSGAVDSADVTFLVENIIGTFYGDANLDRTVDARDLNLIGINWQDSGAGWAGGDFTGDDFVDARDLNLLGLNWRNAAAAAAARVPRAPLQPPRSSCRRCLSSLTLGRQVTCQKKRRRVAERLCRYHSDPRAANRSPCRATVVRDVPWGGPCRLNRRANPRRTARRPISPSWLMKCLAAGIGGNTR